MSSFKSNLDANAQEFISSAEMRRTCFQELSTMLSPIFDGRSGFESQLAKARQASMAEGVNAPCLLGEALTGLATTSPERASTGFRFFMRLCQSLPEHSIQEAVTGITNSLHKLTKDLISSRLLKSMSENKLSRSDKIGNGNRCANAGDAPSQSLPVFRRDQAFGILTFLNLLITRLNHSDTSEDYECIPPVLSSIDLCLLVEHTCSLVSSVPQKAKEKKNTDTWLGGDFEDELDLQLIISEKNWTGWLYQSLDVLLHSLVHFNYLLNSLAIRMPLENWYRGTFSVSSSYPAYYPGTPVDEQSPSYFSVLLARTLTSLRKRLIDGSFSHEAIQHTVVDCLMIMGELVAVTNATWSTSENPMNFMVNAELSDEAEESLTRFMEESNQLS